MRYKDKQKSLLKKTIELLNKDKRTLNELHYLTGLPLYWLQSLKKGAMKNPSVNRIQHLFEFLTGSVIIK